MSKTIIEGGIVLTGDASQPVLSPGYVVVEGDRISAVGPGAAPADPGATHIDASNKLVVPGFVNAHTHLCMTLGRSLGTDATLLEWLSQAQLPFMGKMTPEDYGLAVTLGAIENLKAGTTTVCEVFFSNRYGDGTDEIAAQALEAAGLRGVLFRCSNDLEFAPGFLETTQEIADRSRTLLGKYSNRERVRVGIGPIVPWAATDDLWADTMALSKEQGAFVHLHTAETPEYNELVRQARGKSNVELLAEVGAMGEKVMLNHCIHLSERDIDLIAEHGSPVIHDPTSNMILASGVSPILAMRKKGIRVGLACDGPACNNTQDMFEVMKDAALLQKVMTKDAKALVAGDVFEMATMGGATACGLGADVGSLTPEKQADVVLVETSKPHLRPLHDPLGALVYSARAADVDTVLVGGQIVVEKGRLTTIDEASIIARAQERAEALRAEAGV